MWAGDSPGTGPEPMVSPSRELAPFLPQIPQKGLTQTQKKRGRTLFTKPGVAALGYNPSAQEEAEGCPRVPGQPALQCEKQLFPRPEALS